MRVLRLVLRAKYVPGPVELPSIGLSSDLPRDGVLPSILGMNGDVSKTREALIDTVVNS